MPPPKPLVLVRQCNVCLCSYGVETTAVDSEQAEKSYWRTPTHPRTGPWRCEALLLAPPSRPSGALSVLDHNVAHAMAGI